jgi:hypothetical protein
MTRFGVAARLASALCSGVLVTVCSSVLGSGCLPADDCHVGAVRCDRGELERCTGHPSGIFGPPDDPQVVHGSGPTWDNDSFCGAGRCITPADGDAFCALDDGALAACSGASVACDGTALVDCHEGFVIEREVCLACSAAPACAGTAGLFDPECCQGGPLADCTSDASCSPNLRCNLARATPRCELPCTCPEGAACDACAEAHARAPGDGASVMYTCSSGFCTE